MQEHAAERVQARRGDGLLANLADFETIILQRRLQETVAFCVNRKLPEENQQVDGDDNHGCLWNLLVSPDYRQWKHIASLDLAYY